MLPLGKQFPPTVLSVARSTSLGKLMTVSKGAQDVISTIENASFHHNLSAAGKDWYITALNILRMTGPVCE